MIHNTLQKLSFLLLIFCLLSIEACQKDEDVDPYADNYIGPGSSAEDFLKDDVYTSLVLDIVYEPGVQPHQSAIDELEIFLNTYLNKPKGITIIQREIEDQKQNSLNTKELTEIEQTYRSRLNSKDTLATFIYFANSKYSGDKRNATALGIAYASTSMVIFQETIMDNAGGNTEVERKLLESILKHEFGHLLGLVDVGSPQVNQHEDTEHENHCNSKDCLMYYATETSATGNNISLTLDNNCILDLQANGGK